MTPTKKRKTPPTAKERVLAAHPEARVATAGGFTFIEVPVVRFVGASEWFRNERAAWADAAARLKERKP